MSHISFVFRRAPHGSSAGREGVDALLAASAYCDQIDVLFIGDGVLQLLAGQQPAAILSKDYAPMLKLFDLYDIDQVFVCKSSLAERGLAQADLVIDAELLEPAQISARLEQAAKLLTF
ncbi:sulfurtransferase complex subunit TusC [Vibrio sp.]|uniref:sulfurtransferase complex subunit TusC n=1 Tax=Vibrio sp. TaxID=678 RepID=UPI003D116562